MTRIRVQLEMLEDRCTPAPLGFDSLPAFRGLDVAVEQLYPTDPNVPPNPIAPVFVINYGESVDLVVPDGLTIALDQVYPTDPSVPPNPIHVSPIFFGLADLVEPPTVDA